MKSIGIDPVIKPSSADEILPLAMTMEQAVMFLALKKALNVERLWLKETDNLQIPTVIIAADTIVYKNGMIGKPVDRDDVIRILTLLRNTSHDVATGVALLKPGSSKRSVFYDVTEVFFDDYSDEEIRDYADTGEPWDKAGGYAIQGTWGKHITHIIGNYDNVIGFPWKKIQSELKKNWPEINL